MAIVKELCVSILLLCNHLVESHGVETQDKPNWNAAMTKLDELQNVVNNQANRISHLEMKNDVENMRELRNLQDSVNTQRKHISILEKRYKKLEAIVATQAKQIARQTKCGFERSIQISALQKKQRICGKRNKFIETRLTILMRYFTKNNEIMKTFHSGQDSKNYKKSSIRKGRLLGPETTPASAGNIGTAFYAYLSNHINSPGGHHILTFDTVITNTRHVYHPTSGTFIVPQSGLYVFTWTIRMNANSYHSTELVVNNNVVGITHFNPLNAIDGSVSGTVVVHVDQGDDVLLRTAESPNNGRILSDTNGRSWFAGWALM